MINGHNHNTVGVETIYHPKPRISLTSPKEMYEQACKLELKGKEPTDDVEWMLVMNFIGSNSAFGMEEAICMLFAVIYEVPLETDQIKQIAEFQHRHKVI